MTYDQAYYQFSFLENFFILNEFVKILDTVRQGGKVYLLSRQIGDRRIGFYNKWEKLTT